jgi:hypothetical protein
MCRDHLHGCVHWGAGHNDWSRTVTASRHILNSIMWGDSTKPKSSRTQLAQASFAVLRIERAPTVVPRITGTLCIYSRGVSQYWYRYRRWTNRFAKLSVTPASNFCCSAAFAYPFPPLKRKQITYWLYRPFEGPCCLHLQQNRGENHKSRKICNVFFRFFWSRIFFINNKSNTIPRNVYRYRIFFCDIVS